MPAAQGVPGSGRNLWPRQGALVSSPSRPPQPSYRHRSVGVTAPLEAKAVSEPQWVGTESLERGQSRNLL